MTNYDDTFSARPFVLRLVVNQGTPNVAANTSPVTWALRMIRTGAYPSYSFAGTNTYTAVINGVTVGTGNFTFDFRGTDEGDYITIDSGTQTITHNTNGTKTISVSASASATVVGSASKSGSKTLTTIPRASKPTFEVGGTPVTTVVAGDPFDVITNRASTSFTHTVGYVFGTQSGTIATGVTTDTTWTPPVTLLTEIPSSVSGALQILVDTFTSGGDLIGSTTTSVTLSAGATAVPSFSSVTHEEATSSPDVDTIVGAYVKGISSLDVAIVSPVGYQGSSVVAQKLEIAGQTINSGSGTTGVIGLSGSLDLRATVTDSRGRSYFEDIPVSVLNYNSPTISSSAVTRADAGGTADSDGTYIRLDIAATTQSLVVGTQRNDLKYRVRIKETTDTTPWASVTPAASSAGVGSTGYSGYLVMGTYSVADSWVVRLEVEDNLGTVSAVELTVATGGLLLHMPKDADAIGVGKYWEQGSVDAKEEMYQRDGKRVLDEDDVASTTLAGIVELATDAETQAGTDGTRAVTPAAMASIVGVGEGFRLSGAVYFTASGSFVKADYPNARAVRVRVTAGGAGGSSTANNSRGVEGGGAGATSESIIPVSLLSASETVTIGAGGAGGSSGNAGGYGGSSSFGALVVALGGETTGGSHITGGPGGVATVGDILIDGGDGGPGGSSGTQAGNGGASIWGSGGAGGYSSTAVNVAGQPGRAYGSGGGGGYRYTGSPVAGAGAPGIVVVEVYV